MNTGTIRFDSLRGGANLQLILESGFTFLWNRTDGNFLSHTPLPDNEWYYTTTNGEILQVRETDEGIEWRGTVDENTVINRLRLDDDLTQITEPIGDQLVDTAFASVSGLRIPRDPVVPCLFSFICSSNMRVERIHEMQWTLAGQFGDTIEFNGESFPVYPTASQIADASEEELKDAKLGYRASWLLSTATMISTGEVDPSDAKQMNYTDAREHLKQFTGVGDKVADCVLLYSDLDFTESVPIDTWIQESVDTEYPEYEASNYDETSEFLREHWGEYPGYAQAYIFDYFRTNDK